MNKYRLLMTAIRSQGWAMEPSYFDAMIEFLDFANAGGQYTAEQIEARIGKGAAKEVAKREGSVAVLPLHGTIVNRAGGMSEISGALSAESFGRMFQAAVSDPEIKAIVFDVNSPGGQVPGTDELSQQIFEARGSKPIVAHVNSNMASAAFWIGSAADEIVLNPSAEIGSVGVLAIVDDATKKLEAEGITRSIFYAGEHKAEMFKGGELSESTQKYIQDRVEDTYGVFVKRLATNRGVSQQAVKDNFGKGRMVRAATAISAGMADSVGTLSQVLARFGAKPQGFAMEREKRRLQM